MPEWGVALVAACCVLGVVGTILPIVPGTIVIALAILVWGAVEATPSSWVITAVALVLLGAGQLLKYLVPGRRLAAAGVPALTMLAGGVGGIVGFFVVPLVGVVVGFIVGVFVVEVLRLRDLRTAWPATWEAMKASGLATLIELTAGLLATALWAGGVLTT